jgi:hypothetical protein
MENINDGGPAYPVFSPEAAHKGMTLRDYFAGQALAGVMAIDHRAPDHIAMLVYLYADAMIAERNKQ